MDILAIGGIILGGLILYFGVAEGGGLSVLLNANALIVVLGGTLASIMIGTPIHHATRALKEVSSLFSFGNRHSPADIVLLMINLSKKAHGNGFSSLKNEGKKYGNKFLDRAIKLVSAGIDGDSLRNILEKEIIEGREAQIEASNIFRTMGMYSPMFGLLGTLVGIIRLLQQLQNIEAIGPSMAVAITTMFYGVFLANLVFIPISYKLRLKCQEDVLKKEMIMEGVISIKQGELPFMIKNHLQAFVDKSVEIKVGA